MNTTRQEISTEVDSWIRDEELPSRVNFRPIRKFDDVYPSDPEEAEAYWDFQRWAMNREHELIMSLPKSENESEFWRVELDENGNDISAFNTIDYHRLYPFNKYHYKLKKVYERVKDLAETFASISNVEGKKNTFIRFKNLVENEFKDEAVLLVEHLKKYPQWVNKIKLMEKVADLNSKIRKCKLIWREHAYID